MTAPISLGHDHSHEHSSDHGACCERGACAAAHLGALSRRRFLEAAGIGLGARAMVADPVWAQVQEGARSAPDNPQRKPVVVKPVLAYDVPQRREQTSWRSWGGIHTDEAAAEEAARIQGELEKIAAGDFPMTVLPVQKVRRAGELPRAADLGQADVIVLYAAGGPGAVFTECLKAGKHLIPFLRHRSGPVSLWYEIISPRYLHQHKDALAVTGVDNSDVVVDSTDELAWRLRALCGLKNARGTKIVAIGGPAGWETPKAPEIATAKWKLDISTVSYEQLKPILAAAMADAATVKAAKDKAAAYLNDPAVKLETDRSFVENAFILETVFKGLMANAGATAITINHCMGAIMPISKTTACLTLSVLNDAGYQAYCESDFVVIPAGLLLVGISGHPNFLNDPTYPHAGVITLAHCTAPRKLDGKSMEPARILTHFESDYGAAPKVEMHKGQVVTNVIPDFASAKYIGLRGEIVDAPFLPICRSQIDIAYKVPDEKLALNMPGFHWMTVYGDYLKEAGYALKKVPIAWDCLG